MNAHARTEVTPQFRKIYRVSGVKRLDFELLDQCGKMACRVSAEVDAAGS